MSLDVYLTEEHPPCETCSRDHESRTVYSANITHNLGPMAKAAQLYACMWRPEEHGLTRARDLVPHLEKGLAMLRAEPGFFVQFNSPNGWGRYDNFVPFVEKYLAACERNPDAFVRVSR